MGTGGGGGPRGGGVGASKKLKGREAYLARRAAKESRHTGGVNRLFRLGGGGVALAALVSFLYLVLFGALTESIAEFDVASDAFRAALTSGEPWLVLCHNGTGARDQTFVDSQQSLSGIVKLGVVDCATQGPSGNTVMKALSLRGYPPPVAFVTGNGRRPKQVPYKAFKTIKRLAAWVTKAARPRILRIQSDKDVQRCHNRKACVVVLSPVAPLRPQQRIDLLALAQEHRTTQFAVMHSRRHALHGDDLELVATGLGATQVVAGTGAGGTRGRQLEPAAGALLEGVVVFRRVNASVQAGTGTGVDAASTDEAAPVSTELRARFVKTLADGAAALLEPAGDGAPWGVKLSSPVTVQRLARPATDGDSDDDDNDDVDDGGSRRKRGRGKRAGTKSTKGAAAKKGGASPKRRKGQRASAKRQRRARTDSRPDSDETKPEAEDEAPPGRGDGSARERKAARRKRRADRVRQYHRATGRGADRVASDKVAPEADAEVAASDVEADADWDLGEDDGSDAATEAALARERERARRQAMEEELAANVPHAADPDEWGYSDGEEDDDWGDVDEEIVL